MRQKRVPWLSPEPSDPLGWVPVLTDIFSTGAETQVLLTDQPQDRARAFYRVRRTSP